MPLNRSAPEPSAIVKALLGALLLAACARPVSAQQQSASIEDLINQDRIAEARAQLQALRSEHGPSARTHLLDAMLLHKEGKYQDSLRQAQVALEADPRNAACHKLFGLNLVRLGRDDLAGAYFEAATGLDPNDYTAWYYRGLQELSSRHPRQALASMQKVVDLRPDYVDGYYVLGLAQEQLSDHDLALETYRRAIDIQQRRGLHRDTPYLYMGRLLIALQRYQAAIEPLEMAVEINPQGHEAWTELGRALLEIGRFEDALAPLLRAAELQPLDQRAHYQLMRAYKQLGRKRDARQAMETFRRAEQAKSRSR